MLQIIRSEKSNPFRISISKLHMHEEANDEEEANSLLRTLLASAIEFCSDSEQPSVILQCVLWDR